jgi:hypothetical protein
LENFGLTRLKINLGLEKTSKPKRLKNQKELLSIRLKELDLTNQENLEFREPNDLD